MGCEADPRAVCVAGTGEAWGGAEEVALGSCG